eukprot:365632-Chlamydomonas_euryale.AAC.6
MTLPRGHRQMLEKALSRRLFELVRLALLGMLLLLLQRPLVIAIIVRGALRGREHRGLGCEGVAHGVG